jgi:3-dehydroquinate dehydratase/shikimate dehydrogenase
MTQICVSLTDETTAGVVARLAALAHSADLFEIRGDLVRDLDLLTILRAKKRPLIFACRTVSEGGRYEDAEDRRRLLLLEAVKRGYDYVDVDWKSRFHDVMAEKSGRGLIVSHHDLGETPADLDGLYDAMCAVGADVVKIAVTPRSISDVARLLTLWQRVAQSHATPLVAIAMGPLGVLTRVVGGRYGAPFTYASAGPGLEAAPGQLPADLLMDLYRVGRITGKTRVYGILGQDVQRSLSPILHNRGFEATGFDGVYVPLEAEALEPFVKAIPDLGLAGFSVTRPYKVAILPFLQEVDETAALCESVNTVVVHDGLLQGSTTDGTGVLLPLKRRLDVKDKRVVILGAGGAARAAALALTRKGAAVTLLARDPGQAEFVAAAVGCAGGDLADLRAHGWDVLVNATPVGGAAAPEETLVPAGAHRAGSVVLDMVYDPLQTRLLREAAAAGCAVIPGIEMLVAQATVQFETWTGIEAPAEQMRETAMLVARKRQEDGASA